MLVCAIAPETQTIASKNICHEGNAHLIQFWDISLDHFSLLSGLEKTHGEVTKIAFSADRKTVARSATLLVKLRCGNSKQDD